jgi:hypothetical protein
LMPALVLRDELSMARGAKMWCATRHTLHRHAIQARHPASLEAHPMQIIRLD